MSQGSGVLPPHIETQHETAAKTIIPVPLFWIMYAKIQHLCKPKALEQFSSFRQPQEQIQLELLDYFMYPSKFGSN